MLTPPAFEDLTAGYRRDALPVASARVENTGAEPVTIKAARLNGSSSNCFTLTAAKNVTVAPGETDESSFTVAPIPNLPAGEYSAVLVLILEDGRLFELPFSLSVVKG